MSSGIRAIRSSGRGAPAAFRLLTISAQRYADEVLPLTHPLWGGRRSPQQYAADFFEIANGRYGKAHFRTEGLVERNAILCSYKRYERQIRLAAAKLSAVGVGAVFTPPAMRGRGYATAMLALLLDRERAAGTDVAYLFSDIDPSFYRALGFQPLVSRTLHFRAALLPWAASPHRIEHGDWMGVQRCFTVAERQRPWAFLRTPLMWEWIRMQGRQRAENTNAERVNMLLRRGNSLIAYVMARRNIAKDTLVLDECAYAGEVGAAELPGLVRAAAGDLRRVTGWLPPAPARAVLPAGSVRSRRDAILMTAPLSQRGRELARIIAATADRRGDLCWLADHV